MATTTTIPVLKINYLTQAQYDTALANNQIDSNQLYFTPASDEVASHSHAWSDITNPPASYTPTSHTHDYSKVTFTQTNTSGDEIGKITIDGTTTTLYADSNTDKNVQQNAVITTAGNYPVLLATSTATTLQTNTVNKTALFTYNPSTKLLQTGALGVTTGIGYTTSVPNSTGTDGQVMFVIM